MDKMEEQKLSEQEPIEQNMFEQELLMQNLSEQELLKKNLQEEKLHQEESFGQESKNLASQETEVCMLKSHVRGTEHINKEDVDWARVIWTIWTTTPGDRLSKEINLKKQ